MSPRTRNYKAGALIRGNQAKSSYMASTALDTRKKDIWKMIAWIRWVEVTQRQDHVSLFAVEIQSNQDEVTVQEEVEQVEHNDEEPTVENPQEGIEGDENPIEDEDNEEQILYVKDDCELDDNDEPVTYLGVMHKNEESSEDKHIV